MREDKRIFYFVFIGILITILFMATRMYIVDRNYYKAAHEINENLKADGLNLMMSMEEIRKVYGKEEIFNKGFGGNFFEYPSKGVTFSVSTDADYDLFNKVGDLRISNPEYSLFGIRVGIEESRASEILLYWGYEENIDDYGKRSYIKGPVYIDFSVNKNIILGIRIIVKDKNFDPDRIY